MHSLILLEKLNGIEKQRTRQERALQTVNSLQGEPLGQIYVEQYFDPQAKEKLKIWLVM